MDDFTRNYVVRFAGVLLATIVTLGLMAYLLSTPWGQGPAVDCSGCPVMADACLCVTVAPEPCEP